MGDHHFPEDVIYEILSRLPVKSLARFRCVCKQWLKHINDPYLETIHRVEEEPTPIMFQLLQSVHCNKINHHCEISFLRAIEASSTAKKDRVMELCYKDSYHMTLDNVVRGSCIGLTLVCYEIDPCHGTFLALINPLSKQRYDLPPVKINRHRSAYVEFCYPADAMGIGFDDSTNTLKTVCVTLKEPSVCSLSIDVVRGQLCTMVHDSGASSWREIAQTPDYPIKGAGVFAHGRLHWLVSSHWWSLDEGTKMVWFDVTMEVFGLIDPPKRKGGFWVENQLVDLNGEVGFAYVDDIRVELWMLKREEWALHCTFVLNPPLYIVGVSGCWNNDGDILLTSDGGRRLFVYTLRTGRLREVDRGDRCEADIRVYRSGFFSIQHKFSIKNR